MDNVLSYWYIFRLGVIPINFYNTHIVPILKGKTKPINDLSHFRPISISNTLAQIIERIIKCNSETPYFKETLELKIDFGQQSVIRLENLTKTLKYKSKK